jgi:hypothetical protein
MLGIEKCRLTFDWLAHLCLCLGEEDVDKGDAIVEHSLTRQVMLGEIPRAIDDVQAFFH